MILRTKKEEYEVDIEELIRQCNYILVDYRFVKRKKYPLIKVTINQAGGISHNDCQKVTKLIQAWLDSLEQLPECVLEVSSPGIYRELKSLRELNAFQGSRVCVSYLDNDAKLLQETGLLNSASQSEILIINDEQSEIVLSLEGIKTIRLVD